MVIRPEALMRELESMSYSRLAGSLGRDLKGLIAGVISRTRQTFSASTRDPAEVIDDVPKAVLKAEIEALASSHWFVDCGNFRVYCARAEHISSVLREIGRLRELTFRVVGEGTGKCADLDVFDAYYLHMFVWDTQADAIVAACRLGLVNEILARHGKRGLYTHSLFKYRTAILNSLIPAIELGRSFVRVEYQRSFAPLFLLWRGIAQFVERFPQHAVLFGSVSISNSYSPASRQLMVEYLSAYRAETRLVNQVRPRRPYRRHRRTSASGAEVSAPSSFDELSRMIAQIEPDHKGVPVLLKHYLRLGGRVLAFNLDREFSNTLDSLIMVDLRQIEPTTLSRYMSQSGMKTFRAYHGLDSERQQRAS
jgi:putative hemolysin